MKFTPEDFACTCNQGKVISGDGHDDNCPIVNNPAVIANTKLKAWLNEAPTVHGWGMAQGEWYNRNRHFDDVPTHKARLVQIEEIKPESP